MLSRIIRLNELKMIHVRGGDELMEKLGGYILSDVKQMVGIYDTETAFDKNIILFINSTFSRLQQLGVCPDTGFRLSEDHLNTWDEYVSDQSLQGLVKDYVVDKVWLKFNPPASSALLEELRNQVDELEFSILNITDSPNKSLEKENSK